MADTPNKLEDNTTPVTSNSETVASLTEVTSSSPTSTAAFQPFQQLHEAVLAAVNSNGLSHHSLFAAAAAVAAATNANVLPPPTNQQIKPEIDVAKKESIRASNRERKKKWRIHNEERNKDNDLRCRVNKRAGKLFGTEDSPAKQVWVQEEFEKRRQKRMDKERRKMIVNNALSVPPPPSVSSGVATPTTATSTTAATTSAASSLTENNSLSSIVTHGQLPSFYPPLPQIDTATAAKLLDFPTDLQRQLLEQLNNSMLALTNGIQQTTNKVEEIKQEVMNDVNQSSSPSSSSNVDVSMSTSSLISNEALAAAAAAAAAAGAASSSNDNTTTSTTTSSSSNLTTTNNNNSNNNNNDTTNINNEVSDQQQQDTHEGNKENEANEDDAKEKPEYPMDTVLTLMQLNAGWKQ